MTGKASATLAALTDPGTIAIVGASDDPSRIGGRPIHYMLRDGFQGRLYPVNPKRDSVQGLPCFPSIAALPGPIDLTILAVAPGLTAAALVEAAAKGAQAAIVFSSGFAEESEAGAARQRELSALARRSGIRLLGPNCLGAFSPAKALSASFSTVLDGKPPLAGPVSIVSQSGAFGTHIHYMINARRLGTRHWISTGNEADLAVPEVLGWLAEDPGTEVIGAYAEGLSDGPALLDALERARRNRKPVIFMKVGRSEIGALAAQSHTASLAGEDAVWDAALAQAGAFRANSVEEMVDVAVLAARGVYPKNRRIGLVTISGGAGIHMADLAEAKGLDVAPMPEAAQRELKAALPFAAVRNPVDITAQAFNDLSLVRKNMEVMLRAADYGSILLFFTMVATSPMLAPGVRQALKDAVGDDPGLPLGMVILGDAAAVKAYEDDGFFVFADPARAIGALAALAFFQERFEGPPRRLAQAQPNPRAVALPSRRLNEAEAKAILRTVGIPAVEDRLVASGAEAEAAVRALGRPAALKIVSDEIAHKTEAGGVRLGVTAEAAAAAFEEILANARRSHPAARIDGVLASPMVEEGVEAILGIKMDPGFGPVVMLGLGGIHAEVFKDVAFRLAPIDAEEARRMIAETHLGKMLQGQRGAAPGDAAALAQAVSRLSHFAAAQRGTLLSVDINPLRVLPDGQGVLALDALIEPLLKRRPPLVVRHRRRGRPPSPRPRRDTLRSAACRAPPCWAHRRYRSRHDRRTRPSSRPAPRFPCSSHRAAADCRGRARSAADLPAGSLRPRRRSPGYRRCRPPWPRRSYPCRRDRPWPPSSR